MFKPMSSPCHSGSRRLLLSFAIPSICLHSHFLQHKPPWSSRSTCFQQLKYHVSHFQIIINLLALLKLVNFFIPTNVCQLHRACNDPRALECVGCRQWFITFCQWVCTYYLLGVHTFIMCHSIQNFGVMLTRVPHTPMPILASLFINKGLHFQRGCHVSGSRGHAHTQTLFSLLRTHPNRFIPFPLNQVLKPLSPNSDYKIKLFLHYASLIFANGYIWTYVLKTKRKFSKNSY